MENKRIDFIVCGTQKAGTSSIDEYLRLHSDIQMPPKKELHFFDNEKAFLSQPNYSRYHKNFNFSEQKTRGEVTPNYMYWKGACQRIRKYNPKIKLIFILRNPIERAFSHWKMEVNRGNECRPFSFCIRDKNKSQHRVTSYVGKGRYAHQIRRFKRNFPDSQLLFIKYEDFKEDQLKALQDIFKFIGVDSNKFRFENKSVNVSIKGGCITKEDSFFLHKTYKKDINQAEKLLDWDCCDWII